MTTTPTSGAADLPEALRLSNEDAAMLEQAASMLEAHAVELKAAGADSASAELPDALEALQLKSCPCGATPTALQITGDEQAKWAHVSGNCCGEWEIEYRNNYTKLASTEAMTLAAAAWNEAPRASHGQAPAQAAPAYKDSTPELHVGDSAFESWYSSYNPTHKGDKQRARDAYAAGMGDPLVMVAPAAVAGPSEAVAYLDIGAGGYLDLGTDLTDEALSRLPKGRHALVIAGTYGIDGYIAAPTTQPAPMESVLIDGSAYPVPAPVAAELLRLHIEALQPAPQQEAQKPMAWHEQARAILEGNEIAASDKYFSARPQIVSADRRKVFRAGFERGWDAARAAQEGKL